MRAEGHGGAGVGERHVEFRAEGPRGGEALLVAPTGNFRPGLAFFRSILQVRDPRKPSGWLVGGQSGTNTREIAFLGEQGPALIASVGGLRAHVGRDGGKVLAEKASDWQGWVDGIMADAAKYGVTGERSELVRWTDGAMVREPLAEEPAGTLKP